MSKQKNTGNSGSVSIETSIPTKKSYNFDDLAYVYSYREKIKDLYKKLSLLELRNHSKDSKSYTSWAITNGVDSHLMPILKKLGYCNDQCEWVLAPPKNGDAILIQLELRNVYRDLKKK